MGLLQVGASILTSLLIGALTSAAVRRTRFAQAARAHLLLAFSILALYWFQPLVPLRSFDFWLPSLTLALVVLIWFITSTNGTQAEADPSAASGWWRSSSNLIALAVIIALPALIACLVVVAASLAGLAAAAAAPLAGIAQAQPARAAETPDVALKLLVDGNARYVSNQMKERDFSAGRALMDLQQELAAKGIVLALARVNSQFRAELERQGIADAFGANHLFRSRKRCLAACRSEAAGSETVPPAA